MKHPVGHARGMFETDEELVALDALLASSFAGAGGHLTGIIGVDNDEVVCGLADPAMSSVALNFERAGYQAAEALDRLMRKSKKVNGLDGTGVVISGCFVSGTAAFVGCPEGIFLCCLAIR